MSQLANPPRSLPGTAQAPEIRRLWAVRDARGLRVMVHLVPANDSSEVHPAWMANRDAWINELELRTGSSVRLEQANEPLGEDVATAAAGASVAAFLWRDPALTNC
jgi:hypothetical protein